MHAQTTTVALDHHVPWAAAHGAVFDEHSLRVGIDVEVDPFAAVGAAHTHGVFHAASLQRDLRERGDVV